MGLVALPSVSDAHDLHIWSLSAGMPSLSVHLVSHSNESMDEALHEAQAYLISKVHYISIYLSILIYGFFPRASRILRSKSNVLRNNIPKIAMVKTHVMDHHRRCCRRESSRQAFTEILYLLLCIL
jgi:hypothetical protein